MGTLLQTHLCFKVERHEARINTHSNLLPPCTETPRSTPAWFTLTAPLAALLLGVVVEHVCLDDAAWKAADAPP